MKYVKCNKYSVTNALITGALGRRLHRIGEEGRAEEDFLGEVTFRAECRRVTKNHLGDWNGTCSTQEQKHVRRPETQGRCRKTSAWLRQSTGWDAAGVLRPAVSGEEFGLHPRETIGRF